MQELVGDSKPMGRKPVATPSQSAPQGQTQIVGDAAPLSRTPVPFQNFGAKSGHQQLVGDSAPLNRTPVKGWGSAANLPMSDRTHEASEI